MRLAIPLLFAASLFAQARTMTVVWTDVTTNPATTVYNLYRSPGACPAAIPAAPTGTRLIAGTTTKTFADANIPLGVFCYQVTAGVVGTSESTPNQGTGTNTQLFQVSAFTVAPSPQGNILAWTDTLNPTGTAYSVYKSNGACPIPAPAPGTTGVTKLASFVPAKTYTDPALVGAFCYQVSATLASSIFTESDTRSATSINLQFQAPTTITITVSQP